MKKKNILVTLAILTALAAPVSVFAATSDTAAAKNLRGFFRFDTSKFTGQQKADVKDYSQKMADLQKDFINKMVANGAMTKEQGDAEIKRVDEAIANGETKGFIPGFGGGKGRGGFKAHVKGDGIGKIDTSKLTDQQKTELTEINKKLVDEQKSLVNNMVANGLMTKLQGDSAIERIDEMAKAIEEKGLANGLGMYMGGLGGFGCFGLQGIDMSKLSDQQKAALTDSAKKMAALRKELVNKIVSFGLMTKEQGDAAIAKIDEMQKLQAKNGFQKGFGKGFGGKGGGGRFGGHGGRGGFAPGGSPQAPAQNSSTGTATPQPL